MSKSMLVIDTPTSCRRCKLRYDSYGQCEVCIVADEIVDQFYETNTKPEWCPLPSVPERKDLKQYVMRNNGLEDVLHYNYDQGYNSCLDEIWGETED